MLRRAVWLTVAMSLFLGGIAEAAATAYTVVAGDTRSKIAKRICGNASLYALVKEASGKQGHRDRIYPGDEMIVDCDGSDEAPATEAAQQQAPEPKAPKQKAQRVRRAVNETAPGGLTPLELAVAQTFPDDPARMMAAIKLESSYNPRNVGYNCYYSRSDKTVLTPREGRRIRAEEAERKISVRRSNVVSKACAYNKKKGINHRPFAWSADCGLAQLHSKSLICPADTMDPAKSLAKARQLYDNGGIDHWFATKTKKFLPTVAHYEQKLQKAVVDGVLFAVSTPAGIIHTHDHVTVVAQLN